MAARKPSRRRYSDDDRAGALAALDANAGDLSRTARQLRIPRGTLQQWARRRGVPAEVRQLAQEKKPALAERLEALASDLLDALPAKVGSASLAATATTMAIAIDKAQLLRGKPTAITDNTQRLDDLSDDELDARIAELEARLPRVPGGARPAAGG